MEMSSSGLVVDIVVAIKAVEVEVVIFVVREADVPVLAVTRDSSKVVITVVLQTVEVAGAAAVASGSSSSSI